MHSVSKLQNICFKYLIHEYMRYFEGSLISQNGLKWGNKKKRVSFPYEIQTDLFLDQNRQKFITFYICKACCQYQLLQVYNNMPKFKKKKFNLYIFLMIPLIKKKWGLTQKRRCQLLFSNGLFMI